MSTEKQKQSKNNLQTNRMHKKEFFFSCIYYLKKKTKKINYLSSSPVSRAMKKYNKKNPKKQEVRKGESAWKVGN